MKAKKIEQLLRNIVNLNNEQNEWIKKIPSEISPAFFDNPYTAAYSLQVTHLIDFIFDDWAEDVSYFLYEDSPHKITTKKGDYIINNVKEYVDYMVSEGFIEDDRLVSD